ncbi:hypothetical protein [Nocardia sp. NPDC127526]|uniref:hypothetical protein n=1 Tax=Nocardia sp. NPDC127526 TaxID=3345393 RepID=UPI003625C4DA
MGQKRFAAGFGIAAGLFAAAVGLAAPQAAAETVELAPGVSCDRVACWNDTDDTYRITHRVTCDRIGVPAVVVDATTYVPAHSKRNILVDCPAYTEPGTFENPPPRWEPGEWVPGRMNPDGTREPGHHSPGKWVQDPAVHKPGDTVSRHVESIEHVRAVVDNNPRPNTGSAG